MIVYTLEQRWEVGLRSTYRRCWFWPKNHLFRWSPFWTWQGTENPHVYIEKPTHPKRVTVCCGCWSRGISGPFIFEIELEEAEGSVRYRPFFGKIWSKVHIPLGEYFAAIYVNHPKDARENQKSLKAVQYSGSSLSGTPLEGFTSLFGDLSLLMVPYKLVS